MKHDLVIGRIPVQECFRAEKREPHKLFLLKDGKGLDEILLLAQGIPVEFLSRQDLDRRVRGGTHQGCILEVDALPVLSGEEWLSKDTGDDAVIVLLDGVEDPHNFGAITRSAAALGALAVVAHALLIELLTDEGIGTMISNEPAT